MSLSEALAESLKEKAAPAPSALDQLRAEAEAEAEAEYEAALKEGKAKRIRTAWKALQRFDED